MVDVRISGILFSHDDGDVGLWEGFYLSEEDESAIAGILSKYDTEGCSVRGARKDIAEEIGDECVRFDEDERVASCQKEIQRLRGVVRELQGELNRCRVIAYNAITEGQIEERMSHSKVLEALGVTEEEFVSIMEE